MSLLKDTFVSSTAYNGLPHIAQVSNAPQDHSRDLEDLRAILAKHSLSRGISVRLIHKHFDVEESEVMVFQRLDVPGYGTVQVMQPLAQPDRSNLKGFHYFVDDDGSFQAFEYTTTDRVANLSAHHLFLEEFGRVVVQRGLQRKFGLKLNSAPDDVAYTEFEFPARRSTIMIPEGLPVPESEFDITVITEWSANADNKGAPGCISHSCGHSTSCRNHPPSLCAEEVMVLGGQIIQRGSPVWQLVEAVNGIVVKGC